MLVAAGGCTRLVALPDESVAGVALCKKDASHNLAHVLRLLLLGHKKRDRLGFPQPTSNSFFLELSGSLSLQVDVSRQIAKDRVRLFLFESQSRSSWLDAGCTHGLPFWCGAVCVSQIAVRLAADCGRLYSWLQR